MLEKFGRRLVLSMAVFLAVSVQLPCFAAHDAGEALEEALRSRSSAAIPETVQKFQTAAAKAVNPLKKGAVLSLLAEYLMERQKWSAAAEVYEQMMREAADTDFPGACYGAAHAYLLLDQPEKAEQLCSLLRRNAPRSEIIQFAQNMGRTTPGSPHARLAGFLGRAGAADDLVPGLPSTGTPVLFLVPPPPIRPASSDARGQMSASATHSAKGGGLGPTDDENPVAIRMNGWQSGLVGRVESKGLVLDAEKDSDAGTETALTAGAAWMVSQAMQIRLGYEAFSHQGALSRKVTFDGLDYAAGASLKLRSRFFDVGVARSLRCFDDGAFRLIGGIKFSHVSMRLEQPLPGGTRSGELVQEVPTPYLGIESACRISDNALLYLSVKHFTLHQGGFGGRMTDFDSALLIGSNQEKRSGQAEWYGTLGYRAFLIDGEADSDVVKLRYSGPTFGLESRF